MSTISKKGLIDKGKRTFGFHPDEPFTSIEQIFKTARKNFRTSFYLHAAANYAEYLARVIDRKNCDEENDVADRARLTH